MVDMIDNERVVVEYQKGVVAGIGELLMEIQVKETLYAVNERTESRGKKIFKKSGWSGIRQDRARFASGAGVTPHRSPRLNNAKLGHVLIATISDRRLRRARTKRTTNVGWPPDNITPPLIFSRTPSPLHRPPWKTAQV